MPKLRTYGPSLVVLGTAAVVLFAGPEAVRRITFEQTRGEIVQARLALDSDDVLERLNQAYRDIATVVEPSVVHISAQYSVTDRWGNARLQLSTGSGWVYDELGHIVTNAHVVADAERIEVQLHTGELRDAEVVGIDQFTDIALIRIPEGRLHPAQRSDRPNSVLQGDLVFAFGSPFDFRFSMSSGVVSGMGRSVGVIRDERGRRVGYENFIQVDAAINPGNSGGPLTDIRGHVIGMNTAIATTRNGSALDEGQFGGVGLAIPIEMIEPVVKQLIESGVVAKGYLGVTVAELNAQGAQQFGFIGRGVVISHVDEDGPAARAGVKVSDIVTHVNAKEVGSMAQLRSVISSMMPEEQATLSIWRFDPETGVGQNLTLGVTLSRLDTLRSAGILPRDQRTDGITELGIGKMSTSTAERAKALGVGYSPGVLVEEVIANTRLAERLRPGAIITSVMDKPIKTTNELVAELAKFNLHMGARVGVIHPDGAYESIVLRVD